MYKIGMIIYITGASGSGKTTLLKKSPIKGYDMDDIYASNWKKHKTMDAVQKGAQKDTAALIAKHTHIVFVGLQGKDDLPFTPDIVYILVRKDYEQFYRDKLVRDLNLLCENKKDFEQVLAKEPFKDFRNHFWSSSIVNMKPLDEFKKDTEKMTKHLQDDFKGAPALSADAILKKLKGIGSGRVTRKRKQ
jgi:adenylate kinase family enzyme